MKLSQTPPHSPLAGFLLSVWCCSRFPNAGRNRGSVGGSAARTERVLARRFLAFRNAPVLKYEEIKQI